MIVAAPSVLLQELLAAAPSPVCSALSLGEAGPHRHLTAAGQAVRSPTWAAQQAMNSTALIETLVRQLLSTRQRVPPQLGGAATLRKKASRAVTTTTGVTRVSVLPTRLQLPGITLGVGLGGFVDGIALHQLLQWHHMLTSTNHDRIGVKYYPATTVDGLKMNTAWDGIFHTVCWLAVLAGLALLYARVTHHRRQVWTSPALWGWILVGWGLFNIVEGLIDHHILGIHHVHSGAQQAWWDAGFLLLGVLFVAAGWTIQRRGRPFHPEDEAKPSQPRPAAG